MFSSPLQRAINRGLKPGGDLAENLRELEDYTPKSRRDAQAICKGLTELYKSASKQEEDSFQSSALKSLAVLFQQIESTDAPAFSILLSEGIERLIPFVERFLKNEGTDPEDDILFVLKILAMYPTEIGMETVVHAARKPVNPSAYLWHVILSQFGEGHPFQDKLVSYLSSPPPEGFIAISLLDVANGAALEGHLKHHPFDSEEGREKLEQWLKSDDESEYSYANSATVALPFISDPAPLLDVAAQHPEHGVRMEAAWVKGKLGMEDGLDALADFALDPNHSETARQYLDELGRADKIPDSAQDPSFQAKSNFARWLSHPNELGCPPDELEVVDSRELYWPTAEEQPTTFWIIRYLLKDRTGLKPDDIECGLVGSMTWCFFSYEMHRRPPEDVYAIHCIWELEHAEAIETVEVIDQAEYAAMLSQWTGPPLVNPVFKQVAEINPRLGYPNRLVAVVAAEHESQRGWAVLDGEASQWYPEDEMVENSFETVLLKIHIGSGLLGFTEPVDRKKWLKNSIPERAPEEIVTAYEKLLSQLENASPEKLSEFLDSYSDMSQHYENYVAKKAQLTGTNTTEINIDLYHQIFEHSRKLEGTDSQKPYESISLLGEHFENYLKDCQQTENLDRIEEIVGHFEPFWSENNLGKGYLARAALALGKHELAEGYCLQIRKDMDGFHRSDFVLLLTKLWVQMQRPEEALELLIDSITRMVTEVEESSYASDQKMFIKEYHERCDLFRELFPERAALLDQHPLPTKVLPLRD